MTVKEFVDKYEALKSNVDGLTTENALPLLQELNPVTYVPYKYKREICEKIIKTMYSLPGEGGEFFDFVTRNSIAIDIVYPLLMLSCYTDLEFDWDNFDGVIDDYDTLAKNNIISSLLLLIPEREQKEMDTILQRMMDDFEFNNCSMYAFMKYKIGDLSEALSQLTELASAMEAAESIEIGEKKEVD